MCRRSGPQARRIVPTARSAAEAGRPEQARAASASSPPPTRRCLEAGGDRQRRWSPRPRGPHTERSSRGVATRDGRVRPAMRRRPTPHPSQERFRALPWRSRTWQPPSRPVGGHRRCRSGWVALPARPGSRQQDHGTPFRRQHVDLRNPVRCPSTAVRPPPDSRGKTALIVPWRRLRPHPPYEGLVGPRRPTPDRCFTVLGVPSTRSAPLAGQRRESRPSAPTTGVVPAAREADVTARPPHRSTPSSPRP